MCTVQLLEISLALNMSSTTSKQKIFLLYLKDAALQMIADLKHNSDTSRLDPSQRNTEKTQARLQKYKQALEILD